MPKKHTIADGESTSSLAAEHGLSPHTIWNHPQNKELKAKREQMNVLMPGDVIVIPDVKPKEVSATTGQRHKFVVNNTPAVFRLQLYHSDGRPRGDQNYQLSVENESFSGKTDSRGALTEYISPKARRGKIILLPELETIELEFGRLNPNEEESGWRQRLHNLGFAAGASADELRAALIAFQKNCGLDESGEANEETLRKLEELHNTVCDYPLRKEAGDVAPDAM